MMITKHKKPYGEVVSCLQKAIRRGEEELAMKCAIELEYSFPIHLWNRLRVIAHEDVGIASIETLNFLANCEMYYWDARRRSNIAYRLFISNAILALCRAPKSRLADDFNITLYAEMKNEDGKFEIPDYAIDKHTCRGRRLGRGFDHWLEEGCKLNDESKEVKNIYRKRSVEILKSGKQNEEVLTPVSNKHFKNFITEQTD